MLSDRQVRELKANGFLNGGMLLDAAIVEELCSEVVRIIAQRDRHPPPIRSHPLERDE